MKKILDRFLKGFEKRLVKKMGGDFEEVKCDRCLVNDSIIYASDPYSQEVWPEYGPYPCLYWCEKCFNERVDQI